MDITHSLFLELHAKRMGQLQIRTPSTLDFTTVSCENLPIYVRDSRNGLSREFPISEEDATGRCILSFSNSQSPVRRFLASRHP